MKLKPTIVTAMSLAAGLLLTGCGQSGGAAEEFPKSNVQMIVPFAAGGSVDASARVIAKEMEAALGTEVVVTNKEGASGVVGTSEAAKSRADGHTVLYVADPVLLRTGFQETPFKLDDFRTVRGVLSTPYVILVKNDSPFTSIADIRKSTETITYGGSGVATKPNLVTAGVMEGAAGEGRYVPFDGTGPALQAILGGQVNFVAAEPQNALPYIKSGDLRALAVSSTERLTALPDVPTFNESGLDDVAIMSNYGIIAPTKTPDAAISKLQEAAEAAVESEAFKTFIETNYMTTYSKDDGHKWLDTVRSDTEEYTKLIDTLGITPGSK